MKSKKTFALSRRGWVKGLAAALVLVSSLGVSEWLAQRLATTLTGERHQDASDLGQHLVHNIKSHLKNHALVASMIATYIRLNQGRLNEEQVGLILTLAHQQSEGLRNIGLAPGNRLSYIHPLKNNEAALGLYYPDIPRQWAVIKRVQEQKSPAIMGPIPLVQGGNGLIHYSPVFLTGDRYWGVISLVIDADAFFEDILRTSDRSLDRNTLALRHQPDDSDAHEVFWGNALVFAEKPMLFDITDTGFSWQLALKPCPPDAATLADARVEGGIVSVVLAFLTLALLNARDRQIANYNRLVSISSQIPGAAFQYYQATGGSSGFTYLSSGIRALYAVNPHEAYTEKQRIFGNLREEDQQKIEADIHHSSTRLSRWHGLYRLDTPDRGICWHEYDAIPTRKDGVVVWHGHISDVTDRIRTENKYATLLSTTHDGFLICDHQGGFLDVNEAYCRLTGYTRNELLGMSIADVETSLNPEQIYTEIQRGYARFETRLRCKDGHVIDVDVSVSALTEGDERLIVFVRDISLRKHQETLLRDSENRFRTMANNAPVLIWLSGSDRLRTWFNQVWLDFTGNTLATESGLGWSSGIHPDDVTGSLDMDAESQQKRTAFVMEYRLRRHDGEYRWIRDNGVPRFDDDGETFLGYIGSCIDITDYRKAVERVQDSEERLQFAFQGTGDGVWDWNIADGQIFFSLRWKEMLGYRNEDIGDRVEDWRVLVHPEDIERVLDAIRLHFAGQTLTYVSEHRMQCKDGQYRWILDRGRVVARDEAGNPLRMLGTHTDITTMKNAEAELAARESRFKALFEHTPVAYQSLDREGRFVDVNEPLCELLGYPRQALIGRLFSDFLIEPEDSASLHDARWAGLMNQQSVSAELTLRHRMGHPVSILLNSRTQQDLAGNFVSTHCVLADISARKKVEDQILKAKEAALRLAETRTLFLANMSHEIRTPMNAVLGFLQLLQQTELSVRQLDYTSKARTAAESLLNILNDILNFAKIESGKLELELTPFKLDDGLRKLSLILVSSSQDKNLDILFDVSPTLPDTLIGDPLRLHQVLLNLSSNAVKFTSRGEVVITLKEVLTTPEDVLIEFSVTDTGVGISEEKLSAIFEGFTQAESSTTRHYGGTGLGLAISQRLVRLMGGELTVSSQPGIGSCFSFTLAFPYLSTADTDQTREPTPSAMRVLVVDDNPHGIDSFCKLAQRIGWQVDAVNSGQAALDRMIPMLDTDQPVYQAVFIDRKMAPMDGFSTIRGLRRIQTAQTVPMILMDNRQTYETLMGDVIPDSDCPDAFLVKPATSSMLMDAYTEANCEGLLLSSRVEFRRKEDTLAGLRLLLVEDNPFNQQVASELLTRNGAVVDVANNGQEGVDCALAAIPPYDAILMDVQMPVMDGYEATRQIRQRGHPDQIIIAMTANAFKSDQDACLAAGMNAYIGKPFAVDNMLRIITQARSHPQIPLDENSGTTMNAIETTPSLLSPSATAGSDATAALPVFARDAALDMLDQDEALLREMVGMFWDTYAEQRDLLGNAVASDDGVQAKAIAHSLKGNAGYFAAQELRDCAARLEILCRDQQMTEARVCLVEFDAAVARFKQACSEHDYL